MSISYIDVTEAHRLQDQLVHSKRELEQAYEELQSTVEELETTNEELQSTNEELETTNEELQSTNEELETMNEELQSTNEELETMNEELRHRTQEVNDVNSFLETILGTIGLAVAVLDRNQRVQIWNAQGARAVGRHAGGGRGPAPALARYRVCPSTISSHSYARRWRGIRARRGLRSQRPTGAAGRFNAGSRCFRSDRPRRRYIGRDHDDGGGRA